jgi:hypothetical protein
VHERSQAGKSERVTPTQEANVELARRALEWDPAVLADDMVWHFQSPVREFVAHFEGKDHAMNEWGRIRDEFTGGTFKQQAVDIWPVGDDLVVAHVEVDMTIGDVRHQGTSVLVYRLAGGVIIEGFDIPSPSLFA